MLRERYLLPFIIYLSAYAQPLPTDLFLRGYKVIPTPQRVNLRNGNVTIDAGWAVRSADNMAARSLLGDLVDFHSLQLRRVTNITSKVIRLEVSAGAVAADSEVSDQAYRLTVEPGLVVITGNSAAGLFYGVQTFLQLLRPSPNGLRLPECRIEDWPRLKLRFLHWDTKHHQDRMATIKRYLDWSARFKANMIGFELEDKFAYPSHPVIGAPGAFTPAEMQEIVNYGLERFIQVVPVVQAPAHLGYVLKHPEFAHLRADGNNYQACLCLEDTYKLIFEMYDDLIAATKGVDYFFVSTDEVYYAGIGANCKEPYNPVNRSLKWIEFAKRAREHLAAKGRRMLAWVEYPVLPEHIDRIPADIIDGAVGDDRYADAEIKQGMRQLVYTSMQGAELLFPDYLGEFGQVKQGGRLEDAFQAFTSSRAMRMKPIGGFAAAWADAGLHAETFWLGWTAASRWAWNPAAPGVEQHTAEFMDIFYGADTTGMVEVYRMMQQQARGWQITWDRVVSRVRKPGYGNSFGKGIGTTRYDLSLDAPPLPGEDFSFEPKFKARYRDILLTIRERSLENDRVAHALAGNVLRAERNRESLEVFFALARFMGHHWSLFRGLADAESSLEKASEAAAKKQPAQAVGHAVSAYNAVEKLERDGTTHFRNVERVFEKTWQPAGRTVNGRKFVQVLDDTKDHFAGRTSDLGYMQAPELSVGLASWREKLKGLIEGYAKANNVPVKGLGVARLEE